MRFAELKKYVLNLLERDLNPKLTYHGVHHTEDVLSVTRKYIDIFSIEEREALLLETGALLHDTGFLNTYKDHEEEGARIASQLLPGFGFDSSQISIVNGLIMATKVPQQPTNLLEQIICDADLDYLGREDVYAISETLFIELQHFTPLKERGDWDKVQISFLKSHSFHTDWAIENRKPGKEKYLAELCLRTDR
ncbi:MAG: HD domain-containing protein [Saprospirales bacterium]|nr:MAG: HD domain-containing protein [Saprospirales bacterium]